MDKTNTITTVNLDTESAIKYLETNGFPESLLTETQIIEAFLLSSNDYLDKKINTLLYCSIINKIFYTDIIKFQTPFNDNVLYFLLNKLSELQYYDITHDTKNINDCHKELYQYLATKNRE